MTVIALLIDKMVPMYQPSPRPAQLDDDVPIQGSMDQNVTEPTRKNAFILLSLFYKTC